MNNSKLIVLVEPEPKEVLLFECAMKRLRVRNPVRVMQKTRELRDYLEGEGPYKNRELFPMPRVILLDLDLPGLEAANFLHWLRKKFDYTDILVIGVSNFEVSRRVRAFFDLGMNAFFQKRVNLDDTLKCLREIELLDEVLDREPERVLEQEAWMGNAVQG
jgi:DNA-binding NarL/FixJ family response regulator